MGLKLEYIETPEQVRQNYAALEASIYSQLDALMDGLSAEIKQEMQADAPWEDQTGDARAGLDATVTSSKERYVIWLAHEMFYGVFLELKNGGRYAILEPKMREWAPKVRAAVALVFSRLR